MIVQTSIDTKKFRWNTDKFLSSPKSSVPGSKDCELGSLEQLRIYFPFINRDIYLFENCIHPV